MKSCESFLRKSQFSKLSYLNPGFGGPWDIIGIFFVNAIFKTHQTSLLAKNVFEFQAQDQKCHFGNFSILAKRHFSNRAWNSKSFWPKVFFLKCCENEIYKKYSYTKSRIWVPHFRKLRFSQKGLARFQKFFSIRVRVSS